MDGARFAAEPAGVLGEDAVDPAENAPQALDLVRLIARVLAVFVKRRRHRHAKRLLADCNVDATTSEEVMKLAVEGGDRQPVCKRERLDLTAVGPYHKAVVDEVEVDAEGDASLVHPPRRQPTDVDVERDVPPVIVGRRRGQLDLAYDLGPEVQCVLRPPPFVVGKRRELDEPTRDHGSSPITNATSSTKQ